MAGFAWDPRFVAALGLSPEATDDDIVGWLGRLGMGLPLGDPDARALFLEVVRTAQDTLVTYGPTVDFHPDRSRPPDPDVDTSNAPGMVLHTVANLAVMRVGFDVRDAAYCHRGVQDALEPLILEELMPRMSDAGLFKLIGRHPRRPQAPPSADPG
jgi:hypothetical protein